jgi:hypothetical protein
MERLVQGSSPSSTYCRATDEGRKGSYIEGEGPTYAAWSKPQYISAFAMRVLQSTYVYVKGERA